MRCHRVAALENSKSAIRTLFSVCFADTYVSAMAVSLEEIGKVEEYTLHQRLVKRAPVGAVVYNLTFDYDFHVLDGRADAEDVLIRVDYSNDKGYWEKVVGRLTLTLC